jgi:hypothetical protein
MVGLSISPNHRPRILAGCPTRGNRPGHRDRWRRLDVLASEPSGSICVAAVVLLALIIFMIPALEAASWNAGRPAQG